jgi:hypothetical protein
MSPSRVNTSARSTRTSVERCASDDSQKERKSRVPRNNSHARDICATSSRSLTHQTKGFANAVRRVEIW